MGPISPGIRADMRLGSESLVAVRPAGPWLELANLTRDPTAGLVTRTSSQDKDRSRLAAGEPVVPTKDSDAQQAGDSESDAAAGRRQEAGQCGPSGPEQLEIIPVTHCHVTMMSRIASESSQEQKATPRPPGRAGPSDSEDSSGGPGPQERRRLLPSRVRFASPGSGGAADACAAAHPSHPAPRGCRAFRATRCELRGR